MTEWIILGIGIAIRIAFAAAGGDMSIVYFHMKKIFVAGALMGLAAYVLVATLLMAPI